MYRPIRRGSRPPASAEPQRSRPGPQLLSLLMALFDTWIPSFRLFTSLHHLHHRLNTDLTQQDMIESRNDRLMASPQLPPWCLTFPLLLACDAAQCKDHNQHLRFHMKGARCATLVRCRNIPKFHPIIPSNVFQLELSHHP